MKNIIQKINKRLGFDGTATSANGITELDFDDIKLMYDICKFQKMYRPANVSYFCAPFDREDLKVKQFFLIITATFSIKN